jgi:hypothetical protein
MGSSPSADQTDQGYVAQYPGVATMYDGNFYYFSKGNTNVTGIPVDGIYKISPSNLDTYIASPWSASHFGIGAGLNTSQAENYFPSGTTPSVNLTFYPWWGKNASNFVIKYQVRSIDQIQANQNAAEQSFQLSTYMNSSTSTKINVPINLSGDTVPGAYQVSARIYSNNDPNTALGSDCLDYSVGNANNNYSP